jgi:hypothetical protein
MTEDTTQIKENAMKFLAERGLEPSSMARTLTEKDKARILESAQIFVDYCNECIDNDNAQSAYDAIVKFSHHIFCPTFQMLLTKSELALRFRNDLNG